MEEKVDCRRGADRRAALWGPGGGGADSLKSRPGVRKKGGEVGAVDTK